VPARSTGSWRSFSAATSSTESVLATERPVFDCSAVCELPTVLMSLESGALFGETSLASTTKS
jgi:hypothetical protein